MKIGLIDVDNYGKDKCYPNLPLMKLSAYHKSVGDKVEWVNPECFYDVVYMSKVFSFTKEPDIKINAHKIIKGGSGYAISLQDEVEKFDTANHKNLPYEIEHIYPDYSLYGEKNTAYGFLTRGCPRGCGFCHVGAKEGKKSVKVADLDEFWDGQKNIEIMDPNTFACPDWKNIATQLIESKACVDFNQGVDIRVLNEEKIEALLQMRVKMVHFAWDRYEDKGIVLPKLKEFKEITNWNRSRVIVYILTNFDTTIEQDLERVMECRKLNFQPYIMRYDKEHIKRGSEINALARWVNFKQIFWKCPTFEEYKRDIKKWR